MSGDPVHCALEGVTAIATLDDSKANALRRSGRDAPSGARCSRTAVYLPNDADREA
jgi:hypothetical protein